MMFVTALIGAIGCGIAAVFLVGLVLHDIRSVRREAAYRQHPRARKWQWRPLISLRQTDMLSLDSLHTLKRAYRKLEITTPNAPPQGELVLVFGRDATLGKDILLSALRELSEDKTASVIELIPTISPPHTISSLLGNYRLMLASMLMKSRRGLSIAPTRSLFPVLMRKEHTSYRPHIIWRNLCTTADYLVAFGLPAILACGIFLALALRHTDLLLMTISGFGVFLMTAIWSYDRLPIRWQLGYTLLAPITLGYFFALAWLRPLKMLADMAKAKVPIGVSLFVRVKDILRIV